MTKVNVLENGSFENGWNDKPPTPGFLINQEPVGWQLNWTDEGQPLYDSGDIARGIPECVHKKNDQLPPNEQIGQPDALILDGNYTYKIFHSGASFGASLEQEVSGLKPGTLFDVIVPFIFDLHGDNDGYSMELAVIITDPQSGEQWKRWFNAGIIGHREWFHAGSFHLSDNGDHPLVVPASGRLRLEIWVKSKWMTAKDCFIDMVSLVAELATEPPPSGNPIFVDVPDGKTRMEIIFHD